MSTQEEAIFTIVFTDTNMEPIDVKAAYLTEENDLVTFKSSEHAYVAAVPKHHLAYTVRQAT